MSNQLLKTSYYDIIYETRDSARYKLSEKQKTFRYTYLRLCEPPNEGEWSPKNIPSSAMVGTTLGISRAASAKMMKRLIAILAPYYNEYLKKHEPVTDIDDRIEFKERYSKILQYPEYIENRFGKKPMLWKAEKFYFERYDLNIYSGYRGKEISKREAEKLSARMPVEKSSQHGPSPLSEWWHDEIQAFSQLNHISYSQAYLELHNRYAAKYPKGSPLKNMACLSCRSLLPLGEVIPYSGYKGKVTLRRKYCSDSCKTIHKRSS